MLLPFQITVLTCGLIWHNIDEKIIFHWDMLSQAIITTKRRGHARKSCHRPYDFFLLSNCFSSLCYCHCLHDHYGLLISMMALTCRNHSYVMALTCRNHSYVMALTCRNHSYVMAWYYYCPCP
jgi:hypothetical protein